jgi:hypothetical protein
MADEIASEQQNPQEYEVRMPEEEENFPQPSTKPNEPVPGPPPLQMPVQPVKKKNILTAFFGFIILLFLGIVVLGVFILMSMFVNFKSQLGYYAAVAIVSLAGGALFGLIAKELTSTDKGYLWECSLISFLIAGLISIFVNVQIYLTQKLSELSQQAGYANVLGSGLLSMFQEPSNPLTTSLLIIIFFNIPVLIMFFRMKEKKIWHLVIYLLPIIIFLAIFYLLPQFILPLLPKLSETVI